MKRQNTNGISVKLAAQMTGLSSHTLRAWERRYAVIEPRRTESGRRVYSWEEVEKLKLLSQLVTRGHSIGTLVSMTQGELERFARQGPPQTPPPIPPEEERLTSPDALIAAVRNLDFEELDRQVFRARIRTPVPRFVLEVVSPLMAEIGARTGSGALDIAQEHMLSAVLRNHLGDLLTQVQKAAGRSSSRRNGLPCLVFSTAEGNLHEFGILLAAILAGCRDFPCRYIGPNMPAENLAKASAVMGADIVVLGSVPGDSKRLVTPLREYVKRLSRQLVRNASRSKELPAEIWIGGNCDFDWALEKTECPLSFVPTLAEFDERLRRRAQGANGR